MSNVLRLNTKKNKPSVKILGGAEVVEEVVETETIQDRLRDEYLRGFNEGQQKIKIDLEKDYSDKLYKKYQEVYHVLEAYEQKMEEYESAFENLVIKTSHALASKIVEREIELESIVNKSIKTAIAKIIGANEVRIRINPDDLELIDDYSKSLLNKSSFNKIKFEPDERIEKGGCLIETDIGNVDGRISTQLEELTLKLEESITKKN